ncbi:hypothetical protein NIES204_32180 [Planktothrix agardhii NIES-204]|nr:hypothetical protein NIES204_32180 [Planktothrix agardhii NIES-204]
MSNHVHYLIEPAQPEDLPKIMHFLNWYTAMCFNRMLRRTGHFWEKRYFSDGFPASDKDRALNTLRYKTPCQVSESPELTRIVRQFIEANRAPREAEKDF